jgi:hypothetical protein
MRSKVVVVVVVVDKLGVEPLSTPAGEQLTRLVLGGRYRHLTGPAGVGLGNN